MCGIFGIYGHDQAAKIAYLGLHALQHRGQESAGIAALSPHTGSASGTAARPRIKRHAAMGLVSEVFTEERLTRLPGRVAIGHVRYSTSGSSELRNAQPMLFEYAHGPIAVAHNGNLVDADATRMRLEQSGSIFQTSTDTEVIIHLLARAREDRAADRLNTALGQVEGAYSLVLLTDDQLIAARDPHGFRPLCLGRLDDAHVVASENAALELIGARLIRDIEPGEIVVIDANGVHSRRPFAPRPGHFCVFEHVYFARPNSTLAGRSVYRAREQMGRRLAIEHPADADVVIPVPDSGMAAAIGFARESGLQFDMGLIRSHYVGRTFIEPEDAIRHLGVRLKLSPVPAIVSGQRVVVVDDSVVRGTTSRKIVKMLRDAGAREVHLRISAPPTTHPCFYGIDTPTRAELIASSHDVAGIARYVTCDSLGYLSHAGLMAALDADPQGTGYCAACFTGEYPVALGARRLTSLGMSGEASPDDS